MRQRQRFRVSLVSLFLGALISCRTDPLTPIPGVKTRSLSEMLGPGSRSISLGSITDLGTLGGASSSATAIDASGDVVGFSDWKMPSTSAHAFVFRNGLMTDLGTLGPGCCSNESYAYGINDFGLIVGESTTPAAPQFTHAVLWTNGFITDLGSILRLNTPSKAVAVNNSGAIVGSGISLGGTFKHALLWTSGQAIDLGTLGGDNSEATAINNAGQVVGSSEIISGSTTRHAFLWQSGGRLDLGTLGGAESAANAINDAGQVVGYSGTAGGVNRAFLWDAFNGMVDLGTLPGDASSLAFGISQNGVVVGASDSRVFAWQSGVMTDLGRLQGSNGGYANAVNSRGAAVGPSGFGQYTHATLWDFNLSPTAKAGGPYIGVEGTSVSFNGSTSTDPDSDPLSYDWDFGDGSTHGTGVAPTHAYADNGSYNVVLTVSDGALTNANSTTATVANVPPTASFTHGPSPVPEGSLFTLTLANPVDPSSADLAAGFTYAFDCGAGIFGPFASASSVSCPTVDNGTPTVRAQIQDKDGGVTAYNATQTVSNVAPTVTFFLASPTPIHRGQNFTVRGGFSDPGMQDGAWGWKILRNSTVLQTGSSVIQPPPGVTKPGTLKIGATGTYTLTLQVTDKDGGTGSASFQVTILP